MLDLKELRKDPAEYETKLKKKLSEASLAPLLALDEKVRTLKTEVEDLKSRRNNCSKSRMSFSRICSRSWSPTSPHLTATSAPAR